MEFDFDFNINEDNAKKKPIKIVSSKIEENNNELNDIIEISKHLNEESNKVEEAEPDNGNNLDKYNIFNIENSEKVGLEIINELINQNKEMNLDENILIN